MTPDAEYLGRYAAHGDEAAFGELVRRHLNLVYSAALRVTGDPSLAQEASQVVFTNLARHAASLCRYDTLVGWLHAAARNAALNAVRGEQRRRAREQEAFAMQDQPTTAEPSWEQLRPILDEAVATLPDGDRKAVLLRFFEGLSHQQAGTLLGISEDAAQKRVERALEKLRLHFTGRGVTMSAALLGSTIGANSIQAAPPEFAASVAGTSLANAGAAQSVFLQILFMSTKIKILMVAAIAVVAAVILINWPQAESPVPVASNAAISAPPKAAAAPRPAPSQVEAPAPVPQLFVPPSAPAPMEAAAPIGFMAEPQTDLKLAIATGLHFLETSDALSFFKTLMPPDVAAREGKGSSLEEFAATVNRSPGAAAKFAAMQSALGAIQDVTPVLNTEGTRATYVLDPPVGGHRAVTFNKIGGYWYLNGM